jgi:hypothetical protein
MEAGGVTVDGTGAEVVLGAALTYTLLSASQTGDDWAVDV